MHTTVICASVLWGIATGLTLPGAAHQFAGAPGQPWRTAVRCGWRGWLTRSQDQPAWWPVLLTAFACAVVAQAAGTAPEVAIWLLLVPWGVLLARIDIRVHRLPDLLTLPAAGAVVVLLALAALLPGHAGSWPRAALGALALAGGYFVMLLINPSGLGFGDVKLALTLGAVMGWYGWRTLLTGTVAGVFLAGAAAAMLLVTGRATRTSTLPFAPFMLTGALAGLLLGATGGA
ncbi:A24 family peptidase [Streptomyces sp. PTM05]|uniref:A24 family peptidase n=1 Tax=Streptantibioticus parmotrematis TaxID=2873249 RepID=A0ABS7R1G7_9ACTN|nr:A24 family peptidase [Streptantibioticus parmotrematis]MBY8889314.1 A24 family peptidase [Streptantibioticus parmotrematis]